MDHPLQFEVFKKLARLLLNLLPFSDKLLDIAISIQKQFQPINLDHLNDTSKLQVNTPFIETIRNTPSEEHVINTLSYFTPIANSCRDALTGFASVSQAITGKCTFHTEASFTFLYLPLGTENLVYDLRLTTGLYCCQHKTEMIDAIHNLYADPTTTFEDEVVRCLKRNANHVTFYALSRVLKCTIHIWIISDDKVTGKKQLRLQQFIPPNQATLKRIEILEMFGERTSTFCLLIAKRPASPRLTPIPNGKAESTAATSPELKNLSLQASVDPEKPIAHKVSQVQDDDAEPSTSQPTQKSHKDNSGPSRSSLRKRKSRRKIRKAKMFKCDVCKKVLSDQEALVRNHYQKGGF